ncbi:MAG TPA: helix-turn-helix domain-containing protein [Terriglobales bacterium]|jgi:AraC-like DNA-binding protein|nr:helix-turn-helix domain-containing protein [Terriglobales bacterium]
MAESFSTDLLAPGDRLDAWLFQARQICGDCRFQFPRRPLFRGVIERRTIGGLELTRFSSTPLSFDKSPVLNAGSPQRNCIIITQLEGVRSYRQGAMLATLNPGDSTFVDSGLPWSSECGGLCSRLYLRVPLWLMQNRLHRGALPVLPRISGGRGLGATLFRLMTSLYQEADAFSPEESTSAVETYLEILSACLEGIDAAPSAGSRRGELAKHIEYFIERHLGEPSLSPAAIAEAAGVSVRHLHRLFASEGSSLGEHIRERRLQRCLSDIADPRFADRTITEISLFWGFSDSAHFSRCFKQRFGSSPRAFRARLANGSCGLVQPCLASPEGAARFPRLN